MTALRVRGPSLPDSALSASAPGDFRPVFHFFNVGAIARGEPDGALARRSTRDRRARRSRHRRCPFARARTSRKRLTDRASSSSRRRARATDSSATRGFFRCPPSVRRCARHRSFFSRIRDPRPASRIARAKTPCASSSRARAPDAPRARRRRVRLSCARACALTEAKAGPLSRPQLRASHIEANLHRST